MADTRRPCPCCGHLVFDVEDGWPGSYSICPICGWEDDASQFRQPHMPGGANHRSLIDAQRSYRDHLASGSHALPPADAEPLDPAWRPIDSAVDFFEKPGAVPRPWPDDPSVLCWWLPTFWGRHTDPGSPPHVAIDLDTVADTRQLHAVLKQALGFPDFYGMNWAAFWDAITGLVDMPAELSFTGWTGFEHRTPEAATLRRRLDDYAATRPGFTVHYR